MRIIASVFLFLGVVSFFATSSALNKQKGLVYFILASASILAGEGSVHSYASIALLGLGVGFVYTLFSTSLYLKTTQAESMEELDDFDD